MRAQGFLLATMLAAVVSSAGAADERRVSPELLARGLAVWTERGRDISPLLAPGAITDEERAELNLLVGCTADTVESLTNGDWGVIWICPRSHAPVGRTAATVRVRDGLITKVLMSTVGG